MNDENLMSIDDIDNLLDKEYGLDNPDSLEVADEVDTNGDNDVSVEEDVTEPVESEQVNETPAETPSEDAELDTTPAQEINSKPTDDDKKSFAFENMRKENSILKQEKAELENYKTILSDLAASYGYTDIEKFQTDIKNARYQKEAENKGVDPILYRENMENKARIAELEKQRDAEMFMRKADKFKANVDSASKEYNISEEEIFNRLDKAGFTVDDILSVPNPKLLIDGILTDKIRESAIQSQISEQERVNKLSESKNENHGSINKTITIESLLKEDMKQYKADNFL